MKTSTSSNRIYRLDRFTIPEKAREEFLIKVKNIHRLLRDQPGFVQDLLLEKPASDDKFILITLVEWQDITAVENAGTAVVSSNKGTGFNPKHFMDRLGIKAERGDYKNINF